MNIEKIHNTTVNLPDREVKPGEVIANVQICPIGDFPNGDHQQHCTVEALQNVVKDWTDRGSKEIFGDPKKMQTVWHFRGSVPTKSVFLQTRLNYTIIQLAQSVGHSVPIRGNMRLHDRLPRPGLASKPLAILLAQPSVINIFLPWGQTPLTRDPIDARKRPDGRWIFRRLHRIKLISL